MEIDMWQNIIDMDGSILLWIQQHVRREWATPVVKLITHLGDAGAVWLVLTLLCLVLAKTRKVGILMAASTILNFLVNNVCLKNLVARTRPYEVIPGLQRIIEAQSDFSFPSGHSGASFAVAVVMLMMFPKKVGIPAMALAVLIALSRLYVGVHNPTDVLAGALVGTLAAVIVCVAYKKIFQKEKGIQQM
jgi:undecaprenyl-diphosphatase